MSHLFKAVEKSQQCLESFCNRNTRLLTRVVLHNSWQYLSVAREFCYVREAPSYNWVFNDIIPIIPNTSGTQRKQGIPQNCSPILTLQYYLTQGVCNQIDFSRFSAFHMTLTKGRSWKWDCDLLYFRVWQEYIMETRAFQLLSMVRAGKAWKGVISSQDPGCQEVEELGAWSESPSLTLEKKSPQKRLGKHAVLQENRSFTGLSPSEWNWTRTGLHVPALQADATCSNAPLCPPAAPGRLTLNAWNNSLFVWPVCCQQYVLTMAQLQPSGRRVQALDIVFLDLHCNFQATLYDPIDSKTLIDNINSISKSSHRRHDSEIHGTSSSL